MGLLLEDSNGTFESIHGLGVVCVSGIIISLLNFTHLGSCFDVTFPNRNVFIMLSDLLCHLGCSGCVLLDVSFQHFDLLICLLNSTLLLHCGVITELFVCSKLHLLLVFFLLSLFEHAIHHLNHFLHWSDGTSMGH